MPRWTSQDYDAYQNRRKAQGAKHQHAAGHEPVAKVPRTESHSQRFSIRITSYRVRLIDPDNLCAKYFVDCLRYSGLIPDDTAAVVDYSISQEKVKSKPEERTLVEVQSIPA